tara:strand:- start:115 stop:660 length:546 start_codon:yes stop_codon:yes gene_type:complete
MKGERILYVILILVALVIGIYGGLSGLFTPHHYYEVTNYWNSPCNKENNAPTVIYINEREGYLIRSTISDRKYKLESNNETLNMYIYQDHIPFEEFASLAIKQEGRGRTTDLTFRHKDFYEKYEGKLVPILYMAEHNKIDGGFKFWKEGSLDLEEYSNLEMYQLGKHLKTCEVTKQFLQRN